MLFDIYEDLPDSISYIFDELDKHNIFYWIDAGTLLKGIRDKTILTSGDIDISIHSSQVNDVLDLLVDIKEKGYDIQYNGGYPMLEDLITIFLPFPINNINAIDIYIYHKYNESFVRRSYHKPLTCSKYRYLFYLSKKIMKSSCPIDKYKKKKIFKLLAKGGAFAISKVIFYIYERLSRTLWWVIPEQYFSDFSILQLHSRKFNIPKSYKEYLKFRYGDSWSFANKGTEWRLLWKKGESNILVSKRLSDVTSIKKHWLNECE
jgi:phosphorylcholine metabolism protein LicD